MKRFTLMVVIMFAMLFGAMVERAFAEEVNRGVEDAMFLMESSSYTIDFKQRTTDEIQYFMMTSVTLFRGTIPYANTAIDGRTYEILVNLVNHFNLAANELKIRKKMTSKEYNQYLEMVRIMHEQSSAAYQRGQL